MSLLEEIRLSGNVVKSIQRGTTAATTTGVNVTISPVDTTKTSVRIASARAVNDNIVLVNYTTINVKTSANGNVDWEVVEYRQEVIMVNYAQINIDRICVGVSQLNAEVSEEVYSEEFDPIKGETTRVLNGYMIKIPVYSTNYIGLEYTEDGKWQQPEA